MKRYLYLLPHTAGFSAPGTSFSHICSIGTRTSRFPGMNQNCICSGIVLGENELWHYSRHSAGTPGSPGQHLPAILILLVINGFSDGKYEVLGRTASETVFIQNNSFTRHRFSFSAVGDSPLGDSDTSIHHILDMRRPVKDADFLSSAESPVQTITPSQSSAVKRAYTSAALQQFSVTGSQNDPNRAIQASKLQIRYKQPAVLCHFSVCLSKLRRIPGWGAENNRRYFIPLAAVIIAALCIPFIFLPAGGKEDNGIILNGIQQAAPQTQQSYLLAPDSPGIIFSELSSQFGSGSVHSVHMDYKGIRAAVPLENAALKLRSHSDSAFSWTLDTISHENIDFIPQAVSAGYASAESDTLIHFTSAVPASLCQRTGDEYDSVPAVYSPRLIQNSFIWLKGLSSSSKFEYDSGDKIIMITMQSAGSTNAVPPDPAALLDKLPTNRIAVASIRFEAQNTQTQDMHDSASYTMVFRIPLRSVINSFLLKIRESSSFRHAFHEPDYLPASNISALHIPRAVPMHPQTGEQDKTVKTSSHQKNPPDNISYIGVIRTADRSQYIFRNSESGRHLNMAPGEIYKGWKCPEDPGYSKQ